jgi:acetyltransferase (GNAT) family protein
MGDIRALERADLPAVMTLLRETLPGFPLDRDGLAAVTIDDPWHDEEIPSLVAIEDGEVAGFIRSQVRPMSFDGSPIRGVCLSDLVVSPDHRRGAAGAMLLGRLLKGPQELSWSDSATDFVVRAWRTFGGDVDHVRAADFMLVLRPMRWIGEIAAARARGRDVGRSLMPVGALPAHIAGARISGHEPPAAEPGFGGEDADAAAIAAALPAIGKRIRVAVEWDEPQLAATFRRVESLGGTVATRLVRRGDTPVGWYAYLRREGGVSRLLHLAADERVVGAVFTDLVEDATAAGSAVLTGRAEPHLEQPLRERLAAVGFAWRPVIRARDPDLAAALASGSALLTRLDGELSRVH